MCISSDWRMQSSVHEEYNKTKEACKLFEDYLSAAYQGKRVKDKTSSNHKAANRRKDLHFENVNIIFKITCFI